MVRVNRLLAVACLAGLPLVGCKSLDDYNKLQAANIKLRGQKESVETELYDLRSHNEMLRSRVTSLEGELGSRDTLVASLQAENDRLAEGSRSAQQTLEQMAANYRVGDISITGPKLPVELDSALKTFAAAHPGLVDYDPAHGTVKWKSDLLFALGSDVVVDSAMSSLAEFAEVLKSPPAADFEALVVGHTDTVPIVHEATRSRHPTNWHLSTHRAISVGNVLIRDGYAAERVGVMGCGEYRPIAGNDSEEGRSRNRRVEIYLLPRGSIVASGAAQPPPPTAGRK